MSKPRSSLIAFAAVMAAILAGCDTEVGDTAQETPSVAGPSETAMLVGEPDPTFDGETIPEATLVDPSGAQLVLTEVGEPVLLNLWATWCAPCVVEMPLLNDLARDYAGRLRVLTVNEDGRGAEPVERFFAENDLPDLPRWMDPDLALAEQFGGGPVLPLTIFYDAQGREMWRIVGDYEWDSEEARALIEAALADSDRAASAS